MAQLLFIRFVFAAISLLTFHLVIKLSGLNFEACFPPLPARGERIEVRGTILSYTAYSFVCRSLISWSTEAMSSVEARRR